MEDRGMESCPPVNLLESCPPVHLPLDAASVSSERGDRWLIYKILRVNVEGITSFRSMMASHQRLLGS